MSEQIRRLSSAEPGFAATLDALLAFESSTDAAIEQAVADILAAVRKNGDAAVVEFTRRFDHLDVADMAALEKTWKSLPFKPPGPMPTLPKLNYYPLHASHSRFDALIDHDDKALDRKMGEYMLTD